MPNPDSRSSDTVSDVFLRTRERLFWITAFGAALVSAEIYLEWRLAAIGQQNKTISMKSAYLTMGMLYASLGAPIVTYIKSNAAPETKLPADSNINVRRQQARFTEIIMVVLAVFIPAGVVYFLGANEAKEIMSQVGGIIEAIGGSLMASYFGQAEQDLKTEIEKARAKAA